MKTQLDKFGLKYELFEAVDGSLLSEEEIAKYCDVEAIKAKNMNRGQIGCSLSHYFIYERMVKENIEKALILEDDLVLNEKLVKALPILEEKLNDGEIIMLTLYGNNETAICEAGKQPIDAETNLHFLYDAHFSHTSAYLLTKKTAETMSKAVFPVHAVADQWDLFYDKGGFKTGKCVFPFLVRLSFEKSEIGYVNDGLVNKVLWFIDRYNVPVFNDILKNKRKQVWTNAFKRIKFTEQNSTFVS